MSWLGLTTAGYDAPRTTDILQAIRDKYEALTGLVIDWDRDLFLGSITASMAASLDRLSEANQALYDQRNPHGASGIHADDAAFFVGLVRRPATASQVTLTLAGTPSTPIAAGKIVEGGGLADTQRWTLLSDTVLDGSGVGTVVAKATATGSILATSGQVDKIVTPVSGWDSVTNAASASPGQDRESDAALLARRDTELAATGKRTARALRGELNALAYTTSAVVFENTGDIPAVIDGVTMVAHSAAILVGGSFSTAQRQEIATIIYDHLPIAVPTTFLSGWYSNTVTGADGSAKNIYFGQPTPIVVNIVVVLTLDTGVLIGDVQPAVQTAITTYFSGLAPGDDVRILGLQVAIGSVVGVTGMSTFTLNGGTSDVSVLLSQIGTEGTASIT